MNENEIIKELKRLRGLNLDHFMFMQRELERQAVAYASAIDLMIGLIEKRQDEMMEQLQNQEQKHGEGQRQEVA